MKELIEKKQFELNVVDLETYERAISKLNVHMRNKNFFKPYTLSIHKGELVSQDFSGKNNRQSYYFQCRLVNCDFFEAGFAGSVFIGCIFDDCKFDFSNFQSCDFRNCTIRYSRKEKQEVKSVNFSKSIFSNCTLQNIFFNSANLGESIFDNCQFENNKFRSVVLENTVIKNSFLSNIRFAAQNFDFFTIENITTSNVVIPFPAMPCIINGLQYLFKTEDDIRFTSCGDGIKRISKSEYIKLITEFETYYNYTRNYFPLSNIMISQNRLQEAIYVTVLGIVEAIKLKNFRMVYQYCKLVQNNPQFNIQYRKKLYQEIQLAISQEEISSEEYEFLNMYIDKIKNLLLTQTVTPYLLLDVNSNIDSDETEKTALFINQVEHLIRAYFGGKEEHFLEIRHNSPENFIIQIAADPERLIAFLAGFLTCIGYTCQFANFIIKKVKDKHNQSHSKENKSNIVITDTAQIFKANNINITNINYNIFNVKELDAKLQSGYLNRSE